METTVQPAPAGAAAIGEGIIDSDIHPAPHAGLKTLYPYIGPTWSRYLDQFGDIELGPWAGTYAYPRYMPGTARRDAWPANGGLPGSDLDMMREQHLDRANVALGILEPLGNSVSSRNLDLASAMASAVNEWQLDAFVSLEPRLRASIVINPEAGETALREIDRWSGDRRFAQIELYSVSQEPLGRQKYWPIYERAEAAGLPVGIHVGGPSGARTGSGWASYYNEEHLSLVYSMQTQVMSLVLEGVCERFPKLKFIMIEGGLAWSIPLEPRLDRLWVTMKDEVPKLQMAPSEYMRRNILFSTQPVEEPFQPERLAKIFEKVGAERILYASDYPHWDYDDPVYAFKGGMPDDMHHKIFRQNALDLYRL